MRAECRISWIAFTVLIVAHITHLRRHSGVFVTV